MTGFVVRRIGQMALALLGVSVIVFALIHFVPGDPVRTALGTRFDQEIYDALVRRHGLDQPLAIQYFSWLGSAARGDLGVSFRSGQPVTGLVLERLPATITLAGPPGGGARRGVPLVSCRQSDPDRSWTTSPRRSRRWGFRSRISGPGSCTSCCSR